MTVGYSTTLRNARLDAITSAVAANGLLRIYDGTRPASGGAGTNLLVTLTFSTVFAPPSGSGILTANAITQGTAIFTGVASWARITTSGGAFVADLGVGISGAGQEVTLNTTSISSGGVVACTSLLITAGNP